MTTREQAATLVMAWYREWSGEERRPTPRELRQTAELIIRHGYDSLTAALPILVEIMQDHWPDAVRYGATDVYWPRALAALAVQERTAPAGRDRDRAALVERQRDWEQERAWRV